MDRDRASSGTLDRDNAAATTQVSVRFREHRERRFFLFVHTYFVHNYVVEPSFLERVGAEVRPDDDLHELWSAAKRGDEEATSVTTARLWLCAATATVLRNGLAVLGVSAPERM